MTKEEATAQAIGQAFKIDITHKRDTDGTGYYDTMQRPDGYSLNRFLGDDAELICHRYGMSIQYSDHGACRHSVQVHSGGSVLADVTYRPTAGNDAAEDATDET